MVDWHSTQTMCERKYKNKGNHTQKRYSGEKKLVWKPERVTGKMKEMSYPITHSSVVSYWGLACELWIEMH